MSNRNLNVSQFIANLNNIDDSLDGYSSPSSNSSENASSSHAAGSHSNFSHRRSQTEDDLSIFSNTHFFDFDMGRSTDIAVSVDDLLMQQEKQLQSKAFSSTSSNSGSPNAASSSNNNTHVDESLFNAQLDDLQQYSLVNELLLNEHNNNNNNSSNSSSSQVKSNHFNPKLSSQPLRKIPSRPLTRSAQAAAAQQHQQPPQLDHVSPSNTEFPPPATSVPYGFNFSTNPLHTISNADFNAPPPAKKRKSTATSSVATESPEEANAGSGPIGEDDGTQENGSNRAAAEEDKRRRNTAASARFRIKKKLREQQMERTAKELQDKVQSLESKISQLEMENKWLKNLVVEKNEARDVNDLLDMKKKIMSSGGIKAEK